MLSIIGIALAVYLFMLLMGWGASLLILPSTLRPYQFWIAPWVGLIVVDISTVWLSRIGIGTEKSVYMVCLLGVGLLCFCKYRKVKLTPQFRFIDVVFAGAALVALTLALSPLIAVDGLPTTISLGNNDPQLYALLGDFLKESSIYQKPLLQLDRPNSYMTTYMLAPGTRPGAWLLYSTISSLLNFRTHEIFTISLGVFFALTPPLVGTFTQHVTSSVFPVLCASIISALNVNLLFFNYHGFGAQIPAQGLLILAFLLLYSIDFNAHQSRKTIISLALCLSTLSTLYIELIPFFVLPLLLYFSLLLLRRSNGRFQLVKKISIFLLCVTFITVLVDPLGFYEGFQWLRTVYKVEAGWSMIRWAFPADMVGLFSVYSPTDFPSYLPYLVSFPVSLVVFVTIFRLKQKEFWISLLLFTVAILIWLGLFRSYSYGYHKASAFLNFIIIIVFSLGLGKISIMLERFLRRKHLILLAQFAFLGILSTSLWNAVFPMFMTMSSSDGSHSVDSSLVQLADLPIGQEEIIYIDDDIGLWEQLWAAKFLGDRPMIFQAPNAYYGGDKLVSKAAPSDALLLTLSGKLISNISDVGEKIIWKNDDFILQEGFSNNQVEVSLGKKWYGAEKSWLKEAGSDQFHWLKQNATLKIRRKSPDQTRVSLSIQFVPLLPKTTVDLYLDKKILQTLDVDSAKYYDFVVPLIRKEEILRIHVREGSIVPPKDTRKISIGVNSILVNES